MGPSQGNIDPRVIAMRSQLLGLGVPVPPDMYDLGQLLALGAQAFASQPPQAGPSNPGCVGPSTGWQ
ncbi:hypothetical protein FGB62_157g16 [Gracilaria domingensis]|nr:hypothetical protein FGB62_157g16 [Gracilaria domingensis]